MGLNLNLKLKGIVSPNPFKLLYKTGATAGNESVVTTIIETASSIGYTYYPNSGTTYQASSDGSYYNTNPIIFSGASYSTQYWFKIVDTVTGGYIIENVYTNHEEIYDNCINCCLFTGGTSTYIDCRFSGGSAISDQIITPTPTSTPTTTQADCAFTDGSSAYVIVTPTPTTTTTTTPTVTDPPPTLTPSSNTTWYFNHGAGTSCTASHLEILRNGSQVVLATNTSGGSSGTLTLSVGDQLVIRVNTGNQSSPIGCSNAYVKYDSQQLVEDPQTGFNNAEINVTVTQLDINFGITICGTIGGGICPV
jgi:hypothetical protein